MWPLADRFLLQVIFPCLDSYQVVAHVHVKSLFFPKTTFKFEEKLEEKARKKKTLLLVEVHNSKL